MESQDSLYSLEGDFASLDLESEFKSTSGTNTVDFEQPSENEAFYTSFEKKLSRLSNKELYKYLNPSMFVDEEGMESYVNMMKSGLSDVLIQRRRKVVKAVHKILPDVPDEVIIYQMRETSGVDNIILILTEEENVNKKLLAIEIDNTPYASMPIVPPPTKEEMEEETENIVIPAPPSPRNQKRRGGYENDGDYIPSDDEDENEEDEDEEEEDFTKNTVFTPVIDEDEDDDEDEEEEEEDGKSPALHKKKMVTKKEEEKKVMKKKRSRRYEDDGDFDYEEQLELDEEVEKHRERVGKKRKRGRRTTADADDDDDDKKLSPKKKKRKKSVRYNNLDWNDMESWSEARQKAYKKKDTDPNEFYYRFLPEGEEQIEGKWNRKEKKAFLEKVKKEGLTTRDDRNWGLFSIDFQGRMGYQCANYYRYLIREGLVRDKHFGIRKNKDGSQKVYLKQYKIYGRKRKRKTRKRKKGATSRRRKRKRSTGASSRKRATKSERKVLNMDYIPSYRKKNDENYVNPIPGVLDSITREKMTKPVVNEFGYVLDIETWRTSKKCPYTQTVKDKRKLRVLTEDNIERFLLGKYEEERFTYPALRIDREELPQKYRDLFKEE